MSQASPESLVVNSWTLFAHPLFLDQLELLTQQVEAFRQKDAIGFVKKNATKRLAAIAKLAFEVIPQDPARAEYRQGNTLGEDHKHWFRAKFFQQNRLFFRYHAKKDVKGNVDEAVKEQRAKLDRFNEVSMKFAEPMSDDAMNALLEEQGKLRS